MTAKPSVLAAITVGRTGPVFTTVAKRARFALRAENLVRISRPT
jgi:hypothetical protein